jgi:ubiquinol-cytochrome c reductase cytochrome b subunit
MKRLVEWLDQRMGWRKLKKELLDRNIPGGVNWFYTMGSILGFLFILQAVTGILLAMNYSPSPDHAYDSLQHMTNKVFLGGFIRGLHKWGASAMVLFAFLHALRTFFMAAYKYPRELTWITGVCLFLIIIAFGFTGYLLPWDQKAYWATMVGTKIAEQAFWVGPWLGKILKGGQDLGTLTLTRFYGIHMLVLPAALLALVACHLFLVVWHGISAPPEAVPPKDQEVSPAAWHERYYARYAELKSLGKSFFPFIIAKDVAAVFVIFAVVAGLAIWQGAGLEEMADPTDTSYNPRPEWYFLFMFQLLKYFPGALEAVATVLLPALGVGLLLALPLLDLGPQRRLRDRPWMAALGVLVVAVMVFLTVEGFRAPAINASVVKDPKVEEGRRFFRTLRCNSCHSLERSGGVIGPALDREGNKHDKKWIAAYLRDPKKMLPWSRVPDFKLLDAEIDSLSAYLSSLGGGVYSMKAPKLFKENCAVCHSIGGQGGAVGPDLSEEGLAREQPWIREYIKNPAKLYKEAQMSPFENDLSPDQIEDLSRFVANQRGKEKSGEKAKP